MLRDDQRHRRRGPLTASTLYEAVALGLVLLRGEAWVAGIAGALNTVRVTAVTVPVEHSVKLKDFRGADTAETRTGLHSRR